jgi:hypothetical protein
MGMSPLPDEDYRDSIEPFYEPIIDEEIKDLGRRRLSQNEGRLIFDGTKMIEVSPEDEDIMTRLE